MTIIEIVKEMEDLVASYEAQILALKKEVADLKLKLPPTGIVKIILTDVDMNKVTFS